MMAIKFAWIGLVVICLAVRSLATVYTVGDTSGWAIGVDYGTWTASKKFVVGDSLGEFTQFCLDTRCLSVCMFNFRYSKNI